MRSFWFRCMYIFMFIIFNRIKIKSPRSIISTGDVRYEKNTRNTREVLEELPELAICLLPTEMFTRGNILCSFCVYCFWINRNTRIIAHEFQQECMENVNWKFSRTRNFTFELRLIWEKYKPRGMCKESVFYEKHIKFITWSGFSRWKS